MRNYGSEYKRYQKQSTQKKNRASRNAARNILLKQGKVKKEMAKMSLIGMATQGITGLVT